MQFVYKVFFFFFNLISKSYQQLYKRRSFKTHIFWWQYWKGCSCWPADVHETSRQCTWKEGARNFTY